MNFKKSENVPKIFTRRFDNMSQGPNTSRVDLVADAWTRGAIVTSSCCMTRRPPLPDLIVLHRRHIATLVHCCISRTGNCLRNMRAGTGAVWQENTEVWSGGSVEQSVHWETEGSARVLFTIQGHPQPSRTVILWGGKGWNIDRANKGSKLPSFSLNAFTSRILCLSSSARGYQTF